MVVSPFLHAHNREPLVGLSPGMGGLNARLGWEPMSGRGPGEGPPGFSGGASAIGRVLPAEPGMAACGAASVAKGGRDGGEPLNIEGCGCGGDCAEPGPAGSGESAAVLSGPEAFTVTGPGSGHFGQLLDGELPMNTGPGMGIIWLTAGSSCNAQDGAECALYAVLWNFTTGEGWVYPQENFSGWGLGVAQPAVNAGERYVAYVMTRTSMGAAPWSALSVRDNLKSSTQIADSQSGGKLVPQFPNFYSSGRLLFHRASEIDGVTMGTLYSADRDPDYATPSVKARLGPDSDRWRERGFQDANTHASPAYGGAVPGERMIVTHGRNAAEAEVNPQVHTLDGSTMQEFRVGGEFESCQHPAWNITGDRILCTRQAESVKIDKQQHRLLFGYHWEGSEWGPEGTPLVAGIRPADVPGLAPADRAGGCELVTYKYGEFCLSDDYVVYTMYCSTGEVITGSRVMLVRLSDQTRWDITEFVERHMGVEPGDWQGVYSTCSGVGPNS